MSQFDAFEKWMGLELSRDTFNIALQSESEEQEKLRTKEREDMEPIEQIEKESREKQVANAPQKSQPVEDKQTVHLGNSALVSFLNPSSPASLHLASPGYISLMSPDYTNNGANSMLATNGDCFLSLDFLSKLVVIPFHV